MFSNAAHTLPHSNTAGNFVNMLPETTDLGNHLEVGVKSISIPNTWEPFKEHARDNQAQWVVLQGTRSIPRFPRPFSYRDTIHTGADVTLLFKKVLLFTLLPGMYETNEDLMKQIIRQTHQAFSDYTAQKPQFTISPIPSTEFSLIKDSNSTYHILANPYLSRVLDVGQRDPLGGYLFHIQGKTLHVSRRGPQHNETLMLEGQRFTPLGYTGNPEDAIWTLHPTAYHRNYYRSQDTRQYLQVFTNFTEESIVDNQRKPRLLALPFPEVTKRHTKSTHDVLIAVPHYVPVRRMSLNYLHLWIMDEDGHQVRLERGPPMCLYIFVAKIPINKSALVYVF